MISSRLANALDAWRDATKDRRHDPQHEREREHPEDVPTKSTLTEDEIDTRIKAHHHEGV